MSPEPWLHILIPAHGSSPFLGQAIESVLAAADTSTVVTVVDDGSPGDEVAAAARSARPGVEYVRLERNHGVAGAFQRCVELSRGTYTVLMGSDDVAETCFVSVLRELVARFDQPAMLLPGVTVIDSMGVAINPLADRVKRRLSPRGTEPRELSGDRLGASLMTGNWLYFPAMAWRTDLLRRHGFRQDMQTALDLDLEMRLIFAGGGLAWTPVQAFRYRRHAASVSSRSAASGRRFEEERVLFGWAAAEADRLGWRRCAVAARLHLTSRANARVHHRRAAPIGLES